MVCSLLVTSGLVSVQKYREREVKSEQNRSIVLQYKTPEVAVAKSCRGANNDRFWRRLEREYRSSVA